MSKLKAATWTALIFIVGIAVIIGAVVSEAFLEVVVVLLHCLLLGICIAAVYFTLRDW